MYSLFVIILLVIYGTLQDNACVNISSKYLKYEQHDNFTWSVFSNFQSFSQLKLNCEKLYNLTNLIEFIPSTKILLDDSFSI